MKNEVIKIVVLGPESTGKSTLCKALAQHFQTLWCPEYAREYLLKYGKDYRYEDLIIIAKGQLELEEESLENARQHWMQQPAKLTPQPVLFIDTDMHVMKVWSQYVFGKVDEFIIEAAEQYKADLYLLCNTDLPWVQDELREYPDLQSRVELFEIYRDLMERQSTPWHCISGTEEARLQMAIETVQSFLNSRRTIY